MKTVGELLEASRIKQGMTIEDISKMTHIRSQYIVALENNDYQKLPSAVYVRGFIKNYAESLKMSSETFLAIFRRDFTENRQGQIVPRALLESVSTQPWWYSRIILASAMAFCFTLFSLFIVWQYTNLIRPKLIIVSPENNQVIEEANIKVKGITDISAVVDVNGQLVTVNNNGEFELQIPVTGNQMTLIVRATNRRNNFTEVRRQVIARPKIIPNTQTQ